jgi:hypothetical protein
MTGDLPDYEKKVIVVTIPGEYPGEVKADLIKILGVALKSPTTAQCVPVSIEHQVLIDHRKILGVDLMTPTVTGCLPVSIEHTVKIDHRQLAGVDLLTPTIAKALPISIENPAIAYNSATDRFKVDIEKWTATDTVDIGDRAGRLVGKVYGSQDVLQQRATTKELIVQIQYQGAEINPTLIRALTSADVVDISDKIARELGLVGLKAGTNNIGDVDVLTLPALPAGTNVIGHVIVDTLPTVTLASQTNPFSSNLPIDVKAFTASLPTGTNSIGAVTQGTRTNLKVQPEREDLISLGGVASPNNNGAQIVAPSGTLKPKVYDAEYEAVTAGLHYFYFGPNTTATARRFLSRQTVGVNSKSFVMPRIGNAADGIYLFSAVSETNIPYDIGYTLEA